MVVTDNEINGDARLGPFDRLRYLAGNLRRNVRPRRTPLRASRWRQAGLSERGTGPDLSSPLRTLSEAFLREELPLHYPVRKVAVLDIGCGSGRLAAQMSDAGYRGQYTGVDAANRFAAHDLASPAFQMTFVHGDAHDVRLDGPYDLVLSVSALEHIADDKRLLDRLDKLLSPDGLQVHIVPAPAALLLYLWHGYRQYGIPALTDRFGVRSVRVFALGGAASWLLHFLWITLPEAVLRARLRRAFPGAYTALSRLAFRLDAYLPTCPLGYVVMCPRHGAEMAAKGRD